MCSAVFLVVAAALALRAPLEDRALGRAAVLRMALETTGILGGGAALATAAAALGAQGALLRRPLEFEADPLAAQLRSSNELAPSRRRLEAEWHALRREPAGSEQTAAAAERLLRVRLALVAAEALAREDARLRELDAAVPAALIGELEAAATVLASSRVLSHEARAAVGWQWGACGWRHCGAQADASQALWKLRSNLGMLAALEARFYLDVAVRALDEVLQLCAAEGLLERSRLPRSEYVPRPALERLLAIDEEDTGYDGAHKVLGTRLRAEKQYELEERVLLEENEEAVEGLRDSHSMIELVGEEDDGADEGQGG